MQNEVLSTVFLGVLWAVEKGGNNIGISPVISNIFVGIVMGPSLLDVVPYVEAVKLVGKLGVMMLVIEAGLMFELNQLKQIGIRAFFMASTGTVFPVLLMVVTYYFAFEDASITTTLSLGASLVPTSLGFAAKLLKDALILDTDTGVLICAACVIDDILSMLLLGEVLGLADPTLMNLMMPFVGALVTGIVGMVLAVLLGHALPLIPTHLGQAPGAFLLFGLSLVVGWIGACLKSSDLIGCFVVGVCFSDNTPVKDFWHSQVRKTCLWMTRLFFAGTIALTVPKLQGQFFTGPVFIRAAVMTFCGLFGKMTVGFYATPLSFDSFNMLGWGMGGRGEFSFLIANGAYSTDIISEADYCAVIWALLIISLMAPFGMKFFLKRMQAQGCFKKYTFDRCTPRKEFS